MQLVAMSGPHDDGSPHGDHISWTTQTAVSSVTTAEELPGAGREREDPDTKTQPAARWPPALLQPCTNQSASAEVPGFLSASTSPEPSLFAGVRGHSGRIVLPSLGDNKDISIVVTTASINQIHKFSGAPPGPYESNKYGIEGGISKCNQQPSQRCRQHLREEDFSQVTTVDVDENMNIASVTPGSFGLSCPPSSHWAALGSRDSRGQPQDPTFLLWSEPRLKFKSFPSACNCDTIKDTGVQERKSPGLYPREDSLQRRHSASPELSRSGTLWQSRPRDRSPVHPVVHTLPRTKDPTASCNTSYVFVPITMFTDLDQSRMQQEESENPVAGVQDVSGSNGLYSDADPVFNNNNSSQGAFDRASLWNGHDEAWENSRGRNMSPLWNVDQEVAMATNPIEEEHEEDEISCLDLDGDEEEMSGTTRPGNPVAGTLDWGTH